MDTRLAQPQLPCISPMLTTPSTIRSAVSSTPSFPSATSSRSTILLQLDTTLHKAVAGSKKPSRISSSIASSAVDATSTIASIPKVVKGTSVSNGAITHEREDFSETKAHLESSIKRKRFFVTSEGSLGSANEDIREGDEVVIIFGCSVPVILRRNTNPDSQVQFDNAHDKQAIDVVGNGERTNIKHKENKWEFVGEAFVDGFMDGEALAWLAKGR